MAKMSKKPTARQKTQHAKFTRAAQKAKGQTQAERKASRTARNQKATEASVRNRSKAYSAGGQSGTADSSVNEHGDRFITKPDGTRVKVGRRGTGAGAGVNTEQFTNTKGLAGLARKNKARKKKKN